VVLAKGNYLALKVKIITCIPKGDKHRDLIRNWRPVSLLNVVYKIGSAAVANRMKTMLPELINEDQTGFIPGRYTAGNLRLIYYVLIAYSKGKEFAKSATKRGL